MEAAATMSEASFNFFFDEFMSSNVSDFLSSLSCPTNFDPSSIHIPSSLLTPTSVLEDSMLCIDHNMFINASECSWPSESCNGLSSSQAMCHSDDSSGSLMDHKCMPQVLDEQFYSSIVHTNQEILGNFDLIRQAKPEVIAKECADSEANKVNYSKRKLQLLESSPCTVGSNNSTNHLSPVEINPKKKCRVPANIPRSARNGNASKNDERAFATLGHSSCSYSSEDELNISSPELNGEEGSAIPSPKSSMKNVKTRANKVPATDPQSLYARKRRERINERLRILQNLVPNGTKVNVGTMLEEAVQYVKFLQLQIKLLSSDDLWMHAPIAYNGMNIGLDFDTNLKPAQ